MLPVACSTASTIAVVCLMLAAFSFGVAACGVYSLFLARRDR